jgi:Cd2+/Zn2+-exporting ATPase
LGFFGGIGGASKHGVLVKGGQYLEGLDNVDTVVFDKTGTLTKGVFAVSKVVPQTYISKEQLLKYAALAEVYSTHPIALSIRKAYGKGLHREEIENYNEAPGHGVEATIKGKKILVGTSRFLERSGVKCPVVDAMGTIAHVSVDGQYAGYFVIADELKGDSADTVRMLKKMGVDRIVMLTGDNRRVGDEVAQILGVDEVYSELLPHEKVDKLDMLGESKTKRGKLVFVGDGINDAPVLARADVGVAMGALGSDAAIEAADVVLMTDQPSKLVSAMKIAKRTKQIVWQNIILALSVKGLVLILGALGIATMWEAVFADVGVAIIAVLNAMRVMRISIEQTKYS